MRDALLPLLAVAAALMLVAGVAKLRSPAGARQTLAALGLPAGAGPARGVGAAELCLGASCLLLSGRVATGCLALAYCGLGAAVALRLKRGERDLPCGCFGDAASRTHRGHAVANLACAAVAGAALIAPPPALAATIGHGLAALALLAGVSCATYLIVSMLELLPGSWRAWSPTPHRDGAG